MAAATVEKVQDIPVTMWAVTVDGRPEGAHPLTTQRRVYRIGAASDNLAAQEGIRLFVEELEAMTDSNAAARPALT